MTQKPMIYLYTDGAASGNPGPGGWGAVLVCGQLRKEMSGGFRLTTNNRMELLAVIEGLKAIKWANADVTVVSDSKYVVDAINKGWLASWESKAWKKVKNPDLWQTFLPLYRAHNVAFQWVKGHAGHPENERCDSLAVARYQQPELLPEDEGYLALSGPQGLPAQATIPTHAAQTPQGLPTQATIPTQAAQAPQVESTPTLL